MWLFYLFFALINFFAVSAGERNYWDALNLLAGVYCTIMFIDEVKEKLK